MIFDYRSVPKKYADENDRSLWIEYIKYQLILNEKHGDPEKSPFMDKGLYERHRKRHSNGL